MRFNISKKYYPLDQQRIRKRFTWYPIRVGDEIRWLEVVYIKGYYTRCDSMGNLINNIRWINIYWSDENRYLNQEI